MENNYAKGEEAKALMDEIVRDCRRFTRDDVYGPLQEKIQENIYRLPPVLRVETKWRLRKIDKRKYALLDWAF